MDKAAKRDDAQLKEWCLVIKTQLETRVTNLLLLLLFYIFPQNSLILYTTCALVCITTKHTGTRTRKLYRTANSMTNTEGTHTSTPAEMRNITVNCSELHIQTHCALISLRIPLNKLEISKKKEHKLTTLLKSLQVDDGLVIISSTIRRRQLNRWENAELINYISNKHIKSRGNEK